MLEKVYYLKTRAREIKTEQQLADLIKQSCRELGFSYFALTHHVDFSEGECSAIRIHNYPDDWVAFFDDNRLGASDPVHRASHLTTVGFAWSHLDRMIRLTPRDVQLLERAASRGIGDGYTVPAHVPGELNGSCSFATAPGVALPEDQLAAAHLIGAFAFEAARKLRRARVPAREAPRLTDRQRDCLLWAARGKSDWEISRILGIGQETVVQHIKTARDRYDVAKRGQLAIHALFDGTLCFSDVVRR